MKNIHTLSRTSLEMKNQTSHSDSLDFHGAGTYGNYSRTPSIPDAKKNHIVMIHACAVSRICAFVCVFVKSRVSANLNVKAVALTMPYNPDRRFSLSLAASVGKLNLKTSLLPRTITSPTRTSQCYGPLT